MRALLALLLLTGTAAGAEFPGLPKTVAVASVTASSTKRGKHDRYRALNVLAGAGVEEPGAAWCEGKPGAGVGESITITLAEPTRLDKIRIAAGVLASDALFTASNQPTALEVSLDGARHTVTPQGRAWLEVPVGVPVTTIAIKLAAVKQGKHADSCLSGVELVAGEVLGTAVGVDAAALRALGPAMAEMQRALDMADRAGLASFVAFPFTYNSFVAAVENGPGGPVPVTHRNARALARACEGRGDRPACPVAAWFEPTEPPGKLWPVAPGVVEFRFAKAEYAMTWRLAWKGRWRLVAESEI